MRPFRAYVDTSVFGGCFDARFEEESRRFFDLVRARRVVALISEFVEKELQPAPPQVRRVLAELPATSLESVPASDDALDLRDAFLEKGVLTRKSVYDATHVAMAIAARADAIVSWNFRHIVRIDKIRMYNGIAMQAGFGSILIVTPQEVRFDDEEE